MLTRYLQYAMRHAKYEITEKKRFFGSIPEFPGVWSESKTLEKCREELEEVLEEWIILSLKRGEELPVIEKCNLNRIAAHV